MSSSQSADSSAAVSSPAQTSPSNPAPPNRRLRTMGSGLLIVLLIGGGWWLYQYRSSGRYLQSTDDAYVQADAVTISPKISGYVEEVLVKDNQDVQTGQPLLRIDARDYRAQVAQARAGIDVAQANAEAGRAQMHEQEAAIAQVRAQLGSAQANAEFAAAETRRYAALVQTGAEPSEQLAVKRNQDQQATGQLQAQRAGLAAAERRVAAIAAQVRQAQAESTQAQRDAAQVNADAALITAGINGRVGDKSVRVGQFVQQGTRLMSLVPMDQLYITANFKETQIGLMRAGQPVDIRIDALPQLRLKGHVESIAPGTGAQFSLIPPQNATGNFTKIVQRVPVRIALDIDAEARKVLVPGLSVVAEVNTIGARDDGATPQPKAAQ
ncbi:MAG: HlyD family secretion protein [Comamonas sp.]|nr:HlyD family secretion protein [Comamonas sp.]